VSDFVWRGSESVREGELAKAADPIMFLASLRGQFALHERTAFGEHRLARDPLGVNKLFFAIRDDGELEVSNWLIDLVRDGYSAKNVYSVPSGHYVRVQPAQREFELIKFSDLGWGAMNGEPLDVVANVIRAELDAVFDLVRDEVVGRPVWVTLSGGLDSSLVAALASKRFPGLRAMTFYTGEENDDLFAARRVAQELGIPLTETWVAADELASRIDSVLVYGQDWRDFNVHCAVVNDVLGEKIAEISADEMRPLVLTGDTMNELVADYSPIVVNGHSHYGLPKLSAGRLRRFLVGGLDAGDREVGVFARHGVDVIQPFALCAPAYAALPGQFVTGVDAKSRLVRAVAGGLVPEFVHRRPKVRAQVGNEDGSGGTLGALLSQGVDQQFLSERFAALFDMHTEELPNLIRAGFYRFTSTYPTPS